MIDVSTLTANELVSKLQSGEISSVELCNKYLERIKKFEKDVQAWAHLDKKLLLEKAEEADTYRKSGKPLGPLHGMPIAVKAIGKPNNTANKNIAIIKIAISGLVKLNNIFLILVL